MSADLAEDRKPPYAVVTFCADAGGADWEETLEQVRLLHASAVRADPGVSFILLTDRGSIFEDLPRSVNIRRFEIDKSKLMAERARVQRDFLAGFHFSYPLLLVDTDILICQSLQLAFEREFDIALAHRSHKTMPFNAGVILCGNGRPDAVRAFFARWHSVYTERFSEDLDWYGDQFALAAVVAEQAHDFRIQKLRPEQFNATPHEGPDAILRRPSGQFIVHFKGQNRKQLMRPFWDMFVNRDVPATQAEILVAFNQLRQTWKSVKGVNPIRARLESKDRACFRGPRRPE